MKKAVTGAGCAGIAIILWLAFSGGQTLGTAKTGAFDYDAASLEDRKNWLLTQGEPVARQFNQRLGNGSGPQMRTTGFNVDARRREITINVSVAGNFRIAPGDAPAVKSAIAQTMCPAYLSSALGAHKVQLQHRFTNQRGQDVLSLIISPLTCRKYT